MQDTTETLEHKFAAIDPGPILPYFQCFKIVQAVMISDIEVYGDRALLQYVKEGVHWISVDLEWFNRYRPHKGGYYIRDAEGGAYFASAGPFETSYRELGDAGFTFGEAAQYLEAFKQVARPAWQHETGAPVFILLDPDNRQKQPEIIMHQSNGMLEAAKLTAADIFARDWYLVP